jgi:LysR family transcriptional regulator, transcription activator of glutamate synthase operon
MRLEQLYHIVEVAQAKSISMAAERSYISQPAISASVTKLELELGISLFKRTNQGVTPTDVGELVIEKAIEIIDRIEEMKAIAKTNAQAFSGSLHLAVEPSICNTIMLNILTTFKHKHPNVHVLLKVGESNNVIRDIQSGKVDFGIVLKTKELAEAKELVSKELFQDKLVLLAGPNHKLSARGEATLAEALEEPLVLYNTEYVTECGISEILKRHRDGPLNVAYRLDDFKMIEQVVSMNAGVAFVPQFMAEYDLINRGFKVVRISDQELDTGLAMVWTKRHHLSLVEKELIATIKSLCSMCQFFS